MAFGDLIGTAFTGTASSITNPFSTSSGSATVAMGDLVFCVLCEQTSVTVTGVTDNLGNVYLAVDNGLDGGSQTARAFYSVVAYAGTITALSAACSGSTHDVVFAGAAIAGPFMPFALDARPTQITSDITSPFTCPATGTLAQSDEVVIAWGVTPDTTAAGWSGSGSNAVITGTNISTSNQSVIIGKQVVSSTTTVSPEFTGTNPGAANLGTVSFKKGTGDYFGLPLGIFSANAGSITNPFDATGSATVEARDLVFCALTEQTSLTVTGVSDNLGHNYTAVDAGRLSTISQRAYFVSITSAGSLTTLSATATASSHDVSFTGVAFKGPFLISGLVLDAKPTQVTDTTTPYSAPSTGVLAQAIELVLGFAATGGAGADWVSAVPMGKIVQTGSANSSSLISGQVVAATTAVQPSWTGTAPIADTLGTASFMKKLTVDSTLALAPSSYAVTGSPISLSYTAAPRSLTLSLAPTSYTATGTALQPAVGMSLLSGGYALTGSPLQPGAGMSVGTGAYTVTGSPVSFDAAINIASGTYTWAGATVALTYTPYTPPPTQAAVQSGVFGALAEAALAALPGPYSTAVTYTLSLAPSAYTVTGTSVSRGVGRTLAPSAYAVTGTPISRGISRALASTAYTLTGSPVSAGRSLVLAPTSYATTGAPISRGVSRVLTPTAYALTGSPVSLSFGVSLPLAPAAYTLTGTAIRPDVGMPLSTGAYALTGSPIVLTYTSFAPTAYSLSFAPTSYTLSGIPIGRSIGRTLAPTTYALTGKPVSMDVGQSLATASYALSGSPVNFDVGMPLGTGTYGITGWPVQFSVGMPLAPSAAYAITGIPVAKGVSKALGVGGYALTGSPISLVYSPFVLAGLAVQSGIFGALGEGPLGAIPGPYVSPVVAGLFTVSGQTVEDLFEPTSGVSYTRAPVVHQTAV